MNTYSREDFCYDQGEFDFLSPIDQRLVEHEAVLTGDGSWSVTDEDGRTYLFARFISMVEYFVNGMMVYGWDDVNE